MNTVKACPRERLILNQRCILDSILQPLVRRFPHAWRFPLHERYHRYNDSAFADLKNSSIRGQAIPAYAAGFLQRFAGEGPWAHIDMAGPGYLRWPRPDYLHQVGGTGYGVRLITELARSLA